MSPEEVYGQHTNEWWNDFWSNHDQNFGPPRQELIDIVLSFRNQQELDSMTVVDVGSGNGRYAIPFAKNGINTTAVEYTESGTALIAKRALEDGVKVDILQGDFIELAAKPLEYDAVFSSGLLEEIDTPEDQIEVIKGLQRWTKPNGLLVFKFCLEIQDRGIRVNDGFAIAQFNPEEWDIIYHNAETNLRDSLANIDFENRLRTETIIARKKI